MSLTEYQAMRRLSQAPRRYAKTMAGIPHHYTSIKLHADYWEDGGPSFKETCLALNDLRKPRKFFRATMWYYDANGYQYWWMQPPEQDPFIAELCNVAPRIYDHQDVLAYERPPWEYQNATRAHESLRKRFGRKLNLRGRTVLDIGCGGGQLIDYANNLVEPDQYLGIDPSHAQVRFFAEKHPTFEKRIRRSTFDDLVTARKFDVVACMFGSASYVATPSAIDRMKRLLNPGGRLCLMYYDLDVGLPRWYERNGIAMSDTARDRSSLDDDQLELEPDAEGVRGFVVKWWEQPAEPGT